MGVGFKKELIFGSISILIFSVLIIFHVYVYEKKTVNLSSSSGITSISPDTILTTIEIAKHNISGDCWLIIENKVYVVSDFLSRHPGGSGLIIPYCGKDATQPFLTKDGKGSHSPEALRLLGLIYIGDVNGKVVKQPDTNAIKSTQINRGDDND